MHLEREETTMGDAKNVYRSPGSQGTETRGTCIGVQAAKELDTDISVNRYTLSLNPYRIRAIILDVVRAQV